MQNPKKSWAIQWRTPTSKGYYQVRYTKQWAVALARRLNKTVAHETLSFSAVTIFIMGFDKAAQ